MHTEPWADAQEAFTAAADWFVSIAAAGAGRWDEPCLGEWSVRDVLGHTSRALLTVESYLDIPTAAIDVRSPEDYFAVALASVGDPAAVARRGRDAGALLGPDAATAVSEIARRVVTRVTGEHPDALVATPVGGMRLIDYLPTRTFELTVHTCDLAVALGSAVEVPPPAAAASLALLARLAMRGGQAGPLLLAGTGRRHLPGFTVL